MYAASNFINNEWGELGTLFMECLNCFPTDYSMYVQDKIKAKEILYSYLNEKSDKEVYDHDTAVGLDPETKRNIKKL